MKSKNCRSEKTAVFLLNYDLMLVAASSCKGQSSPLLPGYGRSRGNVGFLLLKG